MFRLALAIPLVGALGLWLGFEVLRALRTGIANAGGILIPRRSRPRAFWLVAAVQAGFALAAAAVLLKLLHELLVDVA